VTAAAEIQWPQLKMVECFLLVIIGVNGTNVIKLEDLHTPVMEREL
jgi:hypothetical protein